jgi:hypothetical protein
MPHSSATLNPFRRRASRLLLALGALALVAGLAGPDARAGNLSDASNGAVAAAVRHARDQAQARDRPPLDPAGTPRRPRSATGHPERTAR